MLYKLNQWFLSLIRPWDKDRIMAPDIDKVTELLRSEQVIFIFYIVIPTLMG